MKPGKSVVLLAAGVLALSACDMNKKNNRTTATENQDTTMGAGTTATDTTVSDPNANGLGASGAAPAPSDVGTGAALGAGAASSVDTHDHSDELNQKTSEGSGAVSDEAVSEDNLSDDQFADDEITDEVEEQEAFPTSQGTGVGDDYEYVDESSSEPNDVRGGRDPRMVPRNNEVDNTSSEPDIER